MVLTRRGLSIAAVFAKRLVHCAHVFQGHVGCDFAARHESALRSAARFKGMLNFFFDLGGSAKGQNPLPVNVGAKRDLPARVS